MFPGGKHAALGVCTESGSHGTFSSLEYRGTAEKEKCGVTLTPYQLPITNWRPLLVVAGRPPLTDHDWNVYCRPTSAGLGGTGVV